MTEAAKTAQSDKVPSVENKPVVYVDIFNPVLKDKVEPYAASAEQISYIKAVLEKTSSDNQMAEKAFQAIIVILTGGGVMEPQSKPEAKPSTTEKSVK